MRAAEGAIEKVVIDGDVQVNVIGGWRPRGMCGTGVIDAIAALLEAGIVEATGRMLAPSELPDSIGDALRRRVVERHDQICFELVHAEDSATGEPICLTQRDVRQIQLGKGAISAGTSIILREYGASCEDLDAVLLAGAFGNFVRAQSAIRIGLLPDVPIDKVKFIGNAAGTGAKMVLAGKTCRQEAESLAKQTRYVELAGRPDFQMEFAEAMLFPEPEAAR